MCEVEGRLRAAARPLLAARSREALAEALADGRVDARGGRGARSARRQRGADRPLRRPARIVFNVNSPDDLAAAERLLGRTGRFVRGLRGGCGRRDRVNLRRAARGPPGAANVRLGDGLRRLGADRGRVRRRSAAPAAATGSSRTGIPFRNAIPASRSRSSGSEEASRLTFAPPAALATCQPPLWPQPWGTAIVPRLTSSVSVPAISIAPCGGG